MAGRLRRVAATALGVLIAGGAPTSVPAADWTPGATHRYPGATAQALDGYAPAQGYGSGTYRPSDTGSGQWEWPIGGGYGAGGFPGPASDGGSSGWGGQSYGPSAGSRAGQTERPVGEYRFRQRPEDRASKSDDAPRFRPDPDLARRSQQSWGVPGHDPSQYGGGPAAVFRPLGPDEQKTGKPTASGAHPGQPAQPGWSAYPTAPGYGYPY